MTAETEILDESEWAIKYSEERQKRVALERQMGALLYDGIGLVPVIEEIIPTIAKGQLVSVKEIPKLVDYTYDLRVSIESVLLDAFNIDPSNNKLGLQKEIGDQLQKCCKQQAKIFDAYLKEHGYVGLNRVRNQKREEIALEGITHNRDAWLEEFPDIVKTLLKHLPATSKELN